MPDGSTYRDNLLTLAKNRKPAVRARAQEELAGPPMPDAYTYLHHWLHEIHGHSGVTMDGFAPASWESIAAWARATGTIVTPDEMRALIYLDAVLITESRAKPAKTPAPPPESSSESTVQR